jgi:hypothetical protein
MSEIDNHIKNALSEYDPQFDPNDWAAMEKLLEKKKRRGAIWLWFLGAALLLGAVGTTTHFYLPKQPIIAPTATITSPTTASNVGLDKEHISQKSNESKTDRDLSTTSSETKMNSTIHSSTSQRIATHSASATNHFSNIHETQPIRKGMATLTISTKDENTSSIQNQSAENERKNEVLKGVYASLSEYTTQSLEFKSLESIDSLPLLGYTLAEEEALLSPDTAKRNQEKTKKTPLRWYLEANGGMNVPFIKHSSFAKIEPEANLLLGLQFKRWRGFTGIGYSHMHTGFDLQKDKLAIQTNDSSILMFVNSSQHYINIPIGISFSVFSNSKVDVFLELSMINHLNVSNELKGKYKTFDYLSLLNNNSYAVADINPVELSNAFQNNTKENINEVNQLLNSPILSAKKYFVSGKFSVGLSYKITHVLIWNIEGSYTIEPKLNKLYGNKMGAGGNTGLRYYFR